MARKIQLEIVGDPSSVVRAFKKASAAADTFGTKVGRASKSFAKGALIAGGAAAGLAISIGVKAVKAASALGEQINKTSVVFGKSGKALQKWATTTATGIGISNQEALQAAGTFGNMLVPMKFARKDAARMSKRMVQLAADMASFNDAEPTEVLDALRAGLAGESEPLRRFGVFLADARLKQEALNMGLYKGKGPLDAYAKAAATYAVILKDTKDAQGDYNRTAGSWPNLLRAIRAQVKDVQAALGKGLLPVVQKAGLQLKTWLADPALKARVTELGQVIGQKLLAAIRAIAKWFRAHWGDIKSAFRTGAVLAGKLATAAQGIYNKLKLVSSVTPGGAGTLVGAILTGLLALKLAAIASSLKLIKTRLLFLRATPWVIAISLVLMNREAIDAWVKKKLGRFYGGGTLNPNEKAPEWAKDAKAKIIANAVKKQKQGGRGGLSPAYPREHGGPVFPGVNYRIGESGPETVMFPRAGMVTPNGGGGVQIGTLNLYGVQNAKQLLSELQRLNKSSASQTRGRHGGNAWAFG